MSSGSPFRRRACALAALASLWLVPAPPHALAAELAVELVTASALATRSREATVEIRTESGAACTIAVISRSKPSQAAGLASQVADSAGRVAWRWQLGAKAARGHWPIVVTCQKGPHLGRLETTLPVR